ncbi:MAG: PRC-barrel domain-containing protein [Candidatus Dormibacteraeota bacterium]|nr:PRC-barrel domain-containing protein [Candidatus Dormibacteraeota bacterium]
MSTHIEEFHFGAAVYTADGKHIGSLRRLIVDGESFDLHALVVKETRMFSGHHIAGTGLLEDDIAVPIAAVSSVTHERVELSLSAAEARRTAPYLTYQYAPLCRGDLGRMAVAFAGQSAHMPRLIEQADKRADELEINPGENVMLGRTGRKLGTVRDLVIDDGELVGVVVHPEGFFKDDVLLQIRFLDRSDDLALFVHLTDEDLRHLQPYHPE